MAQAALLFPQDGKCTDPVKDALQQPASFPTGSWEDLHLADRVVRALHATGYMALRNIEVVVQARVVTLTGRISSYYLKQVAQAAVLGITEIYRLQSDLEVA